MAAAMAIIVFVHPDGRREPVAAAPGISLMQAAVMNGVDGILGECGGSAMCATCHVRVADGQGAPPRTAIEEEMLDSAADEVTPDSRLGCQITVTEALDGLEVRLPLRQV